MPKKQHESWDMICPYATAAIELATGLCFDRTKLAPTGLYCTAKELSMAADRIWPKERTIGQLTHLYLTRRTAHLQHLRGQA
jgi:hypothetical protein